MNESINLWYEALSNQEAYAQYSDALLKREIELESLMRTEGLMRHDRLVEQAKGNALESTTSYGRALLRSGVKPITEVLVREFEHIRSGKPGLGNSAFKQLLDLEPEIIAFLTLRAIINSISNKSTLQSVALNIAYTLEDELRYKHFEKHAKYNFRVSAQRMKRSTTYHRRRSAMNTMMSHVEEGMFDSTPHPELTWEKWGRDKALGLGIRLINIAMKELHWIEVVHAKYTPKDKQPQLLVNPTHELKKWLSDYSLSTALLSPIHLPCVIPPKDFAGIEGGGYHTHFVPMIKFVKTNNAVYLNDLNAHVADAKQVFDAVNIAQKTPWRINKAVYNILHRVWRTGLTLGDLPEQEDIEPPRCPKCHRIVKELKSKKKPHTCFKDSTILKLWKIKAALIHRANAKAFSKRLLIHRVLWLAELFMDDDRFYFPYQLDFRGRMYAVPQQLNPQGTDVAKGLLEFADAKPITDENAANWLAIQVATTWGEDKASFAARIKWVKDNESMILAIADDPLGNTEWSEADSPYCFLAACFDWAGFKREGYGYMSRLPIAQDGTCSGLQHYSAILRDEVGGSAVNLIPSDRPQDIYAVVAQKTIETLEAIEPGHEDYDLAQQWLCAGIINRKTTKRAVMTLPYGSTLYSAKNYIREYVEDVRIKTPEIIPWETDGVSKACNWLGGIVWEAIRCTVIAAAEAMDWLRDVAKIVTNAGLPISWTTPLGLPVTQSYTTVAHRQVKTVIAGGITFSTTKQCGEISAGGDSARTRIRLTLKEYTDDLDGARQITGLAPNFIHSLDASALFMAVNASFKQGVNTFALIHDSFGTHAADSQTLATALRTTFIDMYENNDVLTQFRDGLLAVLPPEAVQKIPPLPERGFLDLQEVNKSLYFFA